MPKNKTNWFNKRLNRFIVSSRIFIVVIALILIALPSVSSATVSHLAEQIVPGVFGQDYTGNWSFMNGSVGIGTTNPQSTLSVNGNITIPNSEYFRVGGDWDTYIG